MIKNMYGLTKKTRRLQAGKNYLFNKYHKAKFDINLPESGC